MDTNRTFGVHFIEAAMTLRVDYELIIDPPILEDKGGFILSFENLTFEAYMQPYLENQGELD